jgi:hypothetical protein
MAEYLLIKHRDSFILPYAILRTEPSKGNGKGTFVPVLHYYAPRMGEWRYSSTILELGT